MSEAHFQRDDDARQKLAITLLRDYLLTLIATQAVGISLILTWLRTSPPKTVIFTVLFVSALILAIIWPAALGFIFSRLRKRRLQRSNLS